MNYEVKFAGLVFDMRDPEDAATVEFLNECFNPPSADDFEITFEEEVQS